MTLETKSQPPEMAQRPHQIKIHGYTLSDDYFWFRDKEDPEVIPHLKRENEYVETTLKPFQQTQNKILEELKLRIKEDDESFPWKVNEYFYYWREIPGQEYKVYCRKKGSINATEQVILDLNVEAKNHNYLKLGFFEVSPNNKTVAYSLDTDGSEKYKIYFKDMESGKVHPQVLDNAYYSLAWANDNKTVFFTQLNEKLRPDRVLTYELGQPSKTTEIIFTESNPEYFVTVYKSRSQRFIFIHSYGAITTECRFLDANTPGSVPMLVAHRQHGIEYNVEDSGERDFFILTNYRAQNFRVVRAPIDNPGYKNWQDIVPHNPSIYITHFDVFRDQIFLIERSQGLSKVRSVFPKTGKESYLKLPESNCSIEPYVNSNFETNEYLMNFCSYITPPSVISYHFADQQIKVLKTKEIPSYNKDKYISERVFAISHDGEKVPLTLVYNKGLTKNGENPCYLYGYGSYSLNLDPDFRSTIFSLVDRGFVVAFANIRGGSEMGRQWYENGKLLNKRNTFLDFIACAEHLIDEKYTMAGKIAICGGSAGGMLVGAVANLRPEILGAVIAHVPFVDVINTMLDDSLPLTTIEYDEWGNPQDKKYFDYMRSYSPYDNVEAKPYPHFFITAGLNDPRVTYWEPAKWAAKLRKMSTTSNLVLLKTNLEAGHGGKSGRYQGLVEYAEEFTFILAALDLI